MHPVLDIAIVAASLAAVSGLIFYRLRQKVKQVAAQVKTQLDTYNKIVADQKVETEAPAAATEAEHKLYSISGNAGTANATIFLSGDSIRVGVADSSGNFTFTNLPPGTYVIIPEKPGSLFHPKLCIVKIVDVDAIGIDFEDPSSVVDSRNYGNFPNTSISVNGTLTYTVQQFESRAAGAPVDSRVSKPVACGTYPQNSRS